MLIVFTQTSRLCEDGFRVTRYEKGKTYEVARSAACYALNNHWARKATWEETVAFAMAEDRP